MVMCSSWPCTGTHAASVQGRGLRQLAWPPQRAGQRLISPSGGEGGKRPRGQPRGQGAAALRGVPSGRCRLASGLMRYRPRSAMPASRLSTPYRADTSLVTSARMGICGAPAWHQEESSKGRCSWLASWLRILGAAACQPRWRVLERGCREQEVKARHSALFSHAGTGHSLCAEPRSQCHPASGPDSSFGCSSRERPCRARALACM